MEVKRKLVHGLVLGVAALLAGSLTPTDAANTTITGMTPLSNSARIHVQNDGRLELPDGSQTTASTVDYSVSMNGVYSFHTYGNGDALDRDSILVDTITRDMLVTNEETVDVHLQSKDNHSGIQSYRLRNERNGSWSSWQAFPSAGSDVTTVVPWTLNTSSEGIRTVYAQFRDRAGNVTDNNLSTHGNTANDAPFAEVVYTTQGPEFDVGIADVGTLNSTYWVSPNRQHTVVRSNQPYVELEFNNITSAWSTPERIYVSVNGRPFTTHQVSNLRNNSYLVVDIPESERNNGPGNIRVYMDDTIYNDSDIETIAYYYDETPPNASANVRQGDGSALGTAVYYNQQTNNEETVLITETENVYLDVNVNDGHSRMARNATHPGFARILVEERTRYEQDGTWHTTNSRVYAENSALSGSHPFTHRQLQDGQTHRLEQSLSNGFETQFRIQVTDNAGNTRTIHSQVFRQANLQLIAFNILDIVNPARENDEVTVTNTTAPQEMSAGGNVTFEALYYWLSAFEPNSTSGQIRITTTAPGYTDTQYIDLEETNILRDKSYPRFEETFMVPDDAPMGAMVTMQGYLTAEMDDDVTHTIYFPSQNRNISQQIGEVANHIQDTLHFNITR